MLERHTGMCHHCEALAEHDASSRYATLRKGTRMATLPSLDNPTTDLVAAAKVLGVARSTAYKLAAAGEFPCKVIRVGTRYRVVTADLYRLLDAA